ncbi:hypothetical protein ABIB75_006842 [Bradyrhizobium sp. GM2.2]
MSAIAKWHRIPQQDLRPKKGITVRIYRPEWKNSALMRPLEIKYKSVVLQSTVLGARIYVFGLKRVELHLEPTGKA